MCAREKRRMDAQIMDWTIDSAPHSLVGAALHLSLGVDHLPSSFFSFFHSLISTVYPYIHPNAKLPLTAPTLRSPHSDPRSHVGLLIMKIESGQWKGLEVSTFLRSALAGTARMEIPP